MYCIVLYVCISLWQYAGFSRPIEMSRQKTSDTATRGRI